MKKSLILITILASLGNATSLEENSYLNGFNAPNTQSTTTTEKNNAINNAYYNNADVKNNNLSTNPQLLQKEIQIKKLKAELQKLQALKAKLKELSKFSKTVKTTVYSHNKEWKTIYIPINQIVTLNFDVSIERIEFLPNPNIEIKFDKKNPKSLIVIAKAPVEENIKLYFANGMIEYLTVKVGGTVDKRHIEYKILVANSLDKYEKLIKKLNVKNVYEYLHNTGIKTIVDFITKDTSKDSIYPILLKNHYYINKYLFKGYGEFKTIYGIKKIPYDVKLINAFETPYIAKIGDNIYRLVLLDIEITNNSDDVILAVTDKMIEKRFSNYVVAYLGNIEKKENLIAPHHKTRILIIIKNKVKNDEAD